MSISIYGLIDPRSGELRYIGKATDVPRRISTHYTEARKGNVLHSRRWLAGLLVQGLKADVEILEHVEDNEKANEAERFWIASMRLAGANLTNRTCGGDGQATGYRPTPESIEKGAVKLRGQKRTAEQRERIRASFNTPEVREKRRAAVEHLKATNQEWLAKVRRGRTGQRCAPETRQKMSASWTPERKAAHAARQKAKPFDARWKEQLSAALRKRWGK